MIQATLVCDSREQLPYDLSRFTSQHVEFEVRREALPAGDYAAYIAEDNRSPSEVGVVERKTHSDLLGSLTHGRLQFEAELNKLKDYGFAALVIETDLPSIVRGTSRPDSKVNPRAIIASLVAFAQRYNIHVCYCGDRRHAEAYVWRLLERWVRDRAEARKAVPA